MMLFMLYEVFFYLLLNNNFSFNLKISWEEKEKLICYETRKQTLKFEKAFF